MRPLSTYRHIAWDWNGTLVDDTEVVVAVMGQLLEQRGLARLDAERYRDIFTFPVSDYYATLGFDFEREPFAVLAEQWVAAFLLRWREAALRMGVKGVLERLSLAGMTHSILSAAEHNLLHEQAAHFGIAGHFTHIRGIDDHHAASKVDLGKRWIASVDVPREEVLLVGDTLHDAEVARELGIDAVLIEGGHQARWRLAESGLPVLTSLEDLIDRM